MKHFFQRLHNRYTEIFTISIENGAHYRQFRALFLFFAAVLIYFKGYKYQRFVHFYEHKLRLSPFRLEPTRGLEALHEQLALFAEDIVLAFCLAGIGWLIFRLRNNLAKISLKAVYAALSILFILFILGDSQVYKLFNVHINLELMNIAVQWPLTLLQGKSWQNTNTRLIRYSLLLFAMLTLILYILYRGNFHRKERRHTLYIVPLLLFLSVIFIIIAPPRPVDDLEKTSLRLFFEDIYDSYTEVKNDKGVQYLSRNAIKAGPYKEQTGLDHLPPGTNIAFILMESTSYNYLVDPEIGPKLFPFLYSLKESPESIRVENFYTHIPHSSISRATMMTGNYTRPDRFYRHGETYSPVSLVSWLKEQNYGSWFLHTCDLQFENQIEYFTRMGLKVYDGKWLELSSGKKHPRVGWGHDDKLLVNWHFQHVLKESKYGTPDQKPFMVVFSHIGAHYPYWSVGKIPPSVKDVFKMLKKQKRPRKPFRQYLKTLSYEDEVSQLFYNRLKKKGLLENTLLIVLADHGESFREHGYKFHNFSMFNEEIRVPFFMVHPKFKASKVKDLKQGAHIDIFPTIADMLGRDIDVKVHGQSLFTPGLEKRPVYMNNWTRLLSLAKVEGQFKYIYHLLSDKLLRYDLVKDPLEQNPVYLDSKENAALIQELLTAREEIVTEHDTNNYLVKDKINYWPKLKRNRKNKQD